jgi:hypothetical protein
MLPLSKKVLPAVVFGVLALSALSLASPPAPPAGPFGQPSGALTDDTLLQMLRGLGYEPTVQTYDDGSKGYTVRIERDGWTFVFTVSLSRGKSVVWISTGLGRVPPGTKVLPEPLLKLLQLNGTMGTARFSITSDGYLKLDMPITNKDVTPADLRDAFELMMRLIMDNAPYWKTGLWTTEGQQAAAFKAKLEALYGRVREAYQAFLAALQPAYEGGPVDRERLHRAHANLVKTIRGVREAMKGLDVPDSPAAREMMGAYQRLIDADESIAGSELAKVVQLVDDSSASATDRAGKVKELMGQADQKEQVALKELDTAYADFFKFYGNI